MCADNLPELVIRLIFKRAIGNFIYMLGRWKSLLNMLAICSRWRRVGTPLLYSNLHIVCASDLVPVFQCVANDEEQELETTLSHNLDLSIQNQLFSCAQQLNLSLENDAGIVYFAAEVLEILCSRLVIWSNITSLRICLSDDMGEIEDHEQLFLEGLAQELWRLLPNVQSLDIYSTSGDEVHQIFTKRIYTMYSRCLKSLHTQPLSLIQGPIMPFQLSKLDIDFDLNNEDQGYFCIYNPPCLTWLALKGIPPTFKLYSMDGNQLTSKIELDNLKHLHLFFKVSEKMSEHNFKIQCPNIASLRLCSHAYFPLKPSQTLLKLKDCRIICSKLNIGQVCDLKANELNWLEFTLIPETNENFDWNVHDLQTNRFCPSNYQFAHYAKHYKPDGPYFKARTQIEENKHSQATDIRSTGN
ncbi:hypothetical protein BX667DRAFT_540307 [Coemansia mojavensis]|nr:hypothetical protein BX667DRAFT_540307 [Coemansia mojavensis]